MKEGKRKGEVLKTSYSSHLENKEVLNGEPRKENKKKYLK